MKLENLEKAAWLQKELEQTKRYINDFEDTKWVTCISRNSIESASQPMPYNILKNTKEAMKKVAIDYMNELYKKIKSLD